MSRKCKITGVSGQFGNRVSHAKNRTRRVFGVNLQTKRILDPETGKYVKVRLSTRAIRTIDKLGLRATLKKYGTDRASL